MNEWEQTALGQRGGKGKRGGERERRGTKAKLALKLAPQIFKHYPSQFDEVTKCMLKAIHYFKRFFLVEACGRTQPGNDSRLPPRT